MLSFYDDDADILLSLARISNIFRSNMFAIRAQTLSHNIWFICLFDFVFVVISVAQAYLYFACVCVFLFSCFFYRSLLLLRWSCYFCQLNSKVWTSVCILKWDFRANNEKKIWSLALINQMKNENVVHTQQTIFFLYLSKTILKWWFAREMDLHR